MKKTIVIILAIMMGCGLLGCSYGSDMAGVVRDWGEWNQKHSDKISYYQDAAGAWSDGTSESNAFLEHWKREHKEAGEKVIKNEQER